MSESLIRKEVTEEEVKEKAVKIAEFLNKENMTPVELIAICGNLLEGWQSHLILSDEKDELLGILCGNDHLVDNYKK